MLWRKPGERVDVLTLVKDLPSSKSDLTAHPVELGCRAEPVLRRPEASAGLWVTQGATEGLP